MDAVSEALAVQVGQRGDPLDRAVTVRDLSDGGVAQVRSSGNQASVVAPPVPDDELTNLSPPPAAVFISYSNTANGLFLRWVESPDRVIRGVSICRAGPFTETPSESPSFSDASPVGFSSGVSYTDSSLAPGMIYYYWLVSVSMAGVAGPPHNIEGLRVTGESSAGQILDDINAQGVTQRFNVYTFAIGKEGVDSLVFAVDAENNRVVLNGNLIASGSLSGDSLAAKTVTAKEIFADDGFFEDIGVQSIFNLGGTENNYTMKIDLVQGFIHIK